MSKVKIVDCVYRLKSDQTISMSGNEIKFHSGQELHIVQDVVYVNGYMVPVETQRFLNEWITNNPNLFILDNRNW